MAIHHLEPRDDAAAWLAGRCLRRSRWSADAGTVFPSHRHDATKLLYVERGSIEFNGIPLMATAGIRIDERTEHRASVGPEGVTCVEAFDARRDA